MLNADTVSPDQDTRTQLRELHDRAPRYDIERAVRINGYGLIATGKLVNVSDTGALIEAHPYWPVGSDVKLTVTGIGDIAVTVARIAPTYFGVAFVDPD